MFFCIYNKYNFTQRWNDNSLYCTNLPGQIFRGVQNFGGILGGSPDTRGESLPGYMLRINTGCKICEKRGSIGQTVCSLNIILVYLMSNRKRYTADGKSLTLVCSAVAWWLISDSGSLCRILLHCCYIICINQLLINWPNILLTINDKFLRFLRVSLNLIITAYCLSQNCSYFVN